MKLKIVVVVIFTVFSQLSFGQIQNSILFSKVLKQLKLEEKQIAMKLAVDKILPNLPGASVVVIPKYRVNEETQYGNLYLELDAFIIIANSQTGDILSKYYEENAWTSDATRLSSIEIDTGLYHLNKETRAFGIRVNYTGSSGPNPYSETNLSLYVQNGIKLEQVLKNLTVSVFRGEWDTRCAGESEDDNSVITIGKLKTKQYNNLIVKTSTIKGITKLVNGDCLEKKKYFTRSNELKFNGKIYK